VDKEEARELLTHIDRIVSDRIDRAVTTLHEEIRSFRSETISHFDAITRASNGWKRSTSCS
jgi:hypothetical protein